MDNFCPDIQRYITDFLAKCKCCNKYQIYYYRYCSLCNYFICDNCTYNMSFRDEVTRIVCHECLHKS